VAEENKVAKTRMMRLCDSGAISEGQLSRFSLEDLDIVVSRFQGRLVALEDRCGHMAAPISMGKVEGCTVVCPLHDAAFDLTTGGIVRGARLPTPPAGQESNPRLRLFGLVRTYPLKVFRISERDGGVFIEMPDNTRT
jgi:3-phenylpropionate/trans-cinnamate dioxygenase ferredoxin subunit